MTLVKRWRRSLFVSMVLLVIILFLNRWGLQLANPWIQRALPKSVLLTGLHGNLLGTLYCDQLSYRQGTRSILLQHLQAKLSWWALLTHQLRLRAVIIDKALVIWPPAPTITNHDTLPLPSWGLAVTDLSLLQAQLHIGPHVIHIKHWSGEYYFSRPTLNSHSRWQQVTFAQRALSSYNGILIAHNDLKTGIGHWQLTSHWHYQQHTLPLMLARFTNQENALTLTQLSIPDDNAQLHGQIQVQWQPINAQGKIDFTAQLRSPLSGQLQFHWQQQQSLWRLQGKWQQQPIQFTMTTHNKQAKPITLQAKARFAEMHLHLAGRLTPTLKLQLQLQADSFPKVLRPLQGQLQAQATWQQQQFNAHYQLDAMQMGAVNIEHYQGQLHLNPWHHWQWQQQWRNLRYGSHLLLKRLQIIANGQGLRHTAHIQAQRLTQAWQARLSGQHQSAHWQETLQQLTWQQTPKRPWHLVAPSQLTLSKPDWHWALTPVCLRQKNHHWCVSATHQQALSWHWHSQFQGLPLAAMLPERYHTDARLAGEVTLNYHSIWSGQARVKLLQPSTLQLQTPLGLHRIILNQAQLGLQWQPSVCQADASLQLAAQNQFQAHVNARHCRLTHIAAIAEKPMQATLRVTSNDLRWLNVLSPYVEIHQGHAEGKLSMTGTLNKPRLRAQLDAASDDMTLPRLNITAKQVSVTVTSPSDNQYRLAAKARMGAGELKLRGNIDWPDKHYQSHWRLQGENALISNLPELQLRVSPDLTLQTQQQQLDLSGQIKIPYALIKPHDYAHTVESSQDIVLFKNGRRVTSVTTLPQWQLASNINIIIGSKVKLQYAGLQARLGGQVNLRQTPGGLITADGKINLVGGRYQAYGQTLRLQPSQLIYSGGAMTNPGLNIRASKSILAPLGFSSDSDNFGQNSTLAGSSRIILGVQVDGTAHNPHVRFFSRPAMSQSDVLSYLITGRPASQASQADGQLILTALSSLNLGGNAINQTTNSLKKSLGLSELGLSSQSNLEDATQNNTSIVLGKYITPRLYLNYNVGLIQSLNTLRVRYSLSHRWSLQAETNGLGRGLDIFYELGR